MTLEEDWDVMCSLFPWRAMDACWPLQECEILFIAKQGMCSERIGIAIPERRMVLLSHTDIDYDDILYWIQIPRDPRKG
jgi:hypothetical protein